MRFVLEEDWKPAAAGTILETIDSILNLPAKYDELSKGLARRLHEDFSHFGINLTHLYTNAITPPPEVQQAIDDRSRMGVFDDMNKLMQMKSAMAMEKASEAEGGSGTGMGTGMGLMMPAMFAQYFAGALPQPNQKEVKQATSCPDCNQSIPVDAKYIPRILTLFQPVLRLLYFLKEHQ